VANLLFLYYLGKIIHAIPIFTIFYNLLKRLHYKLIRLSR